MQAINSTLFPRETIFLTHKGSNSNAQHQPQQHILNNYNGMLESANLDSSLAFQEACDSTQLVNQQIIDSPVEDPTNEDQP